MELRIVIPDTVAPRVLAAFAAHFGYTATLPDGTANPQTSAQFARDTVKAWIKQTVKEHEEQVAVDDARAAVVPVEF